MTTSSNKSLTEQRIKSLRGRGHLLNPVILIGQHGLTEAVQLEIDQALRDHELIKIKISGQDRSQREAWLQAITLEQKATLIHKIGFVAVFYRPSNKKKKNNEKG